MTRIKTSIILCTYRNPFLLKGCLKSLLKQSSNPNHYEIVVVDNNSQDNTAEIVHSLNKYSKNIFYYLEQETGLSIARNTGIRQSRGEIVAFIDDDAIAHPNWITEIEKCYSDESVWSAGGKVVLKWVEKKPAWLTENMYPNLSYTNLGDEIMALKWPDHLIGTNISFRKNIFGRIGFFNEDLGRKGKLLIGNEETEIQERIHLAGGRIIYNPAAVVEHLCRLRG